MSVSITELRRRILKERGLIPPKPHKIKLPITQPEEWIPAEEIPLTPKMKYVEAHYRVKLKLDIFIGSLNDVCHRYNWEVDRSTISRWRKHMRRFLIQKT